IVGVCGVRILWIYTVFASTHNLIALYLSYPVSWVITVIIHFVTLLIARNRAFARLGKNKGNKDNNDKNDSNDSKENKDNLLAQTAVNGQRGFCEVVGQESQQMSEI
ncbi:MAG: hypothetical protein RR416_01085, partial [Clostridia bacterium]